jgi:type I restriction enzyme M protein
VQLIDASNLWQKMRKSLGSKRKELSDDHIAEITRLFGDAKEVYIDPETGKPVKQKTAGSNGQTKGIPISRIFKNTDFGYQTITVERPELDATGKVAKELKGKRKGLPKPDAKLRDSEDVPLGDDIEAYFQREVIPHVPDAWIDHDKTKIGYEIPFNRHFYVFKPPRELAEIDKELKGVTDRIVNMIGELSQ